MASRLCLSLIIWAAGLGLAAAQECTCSTPASFKGHIEQSAVVFVGVARLKGNEVQGSIMRPIKGCLEIGAVTTLMTNPECPTAAPPLDKVALFTGRKYVPRTHSTTESIIQHHNNTSNIRPS
jgi:hypothetical protein